MDERQPTGPGRHVGEPHTSPKIVVVGPCAAGKSTVVNALQAQGYNASASGQEHSEIATLWEHSQPDILIALEVDISAVRVRRGDDWPEWLHDLQVQRLNAASGAADLRVNTTELDAASVIDRVLAFLDARTGA